KPHPNLEHRRHHRPRCHFLGNRHYRLKPNQTYIKIRLPADFFLDLILSCIGCRKQSISQIA
ncbi:MAG TPA: hypothetical protein PLB46_17295, partial [Chitinophagales bacterium]|nr:hypothetical protein [Chitinophagales bacterium]